MTEGESFGLILSLVFLLFSAFFSSSEAAFLSLQKARITHLVTTGVPGAARVSNMIAQPERLLSTILLGNNLVNVAFAALVTVLVTSRLGEGRGVIVATAVGTITLLIVGETIPKSIAVRRAEAVAFLYARPLKWVDTLMLPLVIALQWLSRRISTLLGGGDSITSVTEGEIRTLIDIGEAEGTFEPAEAEMLDNVFRFGDREVREVMTPRTEIVGIESGSTLKQFFEKYRADPHTRFPVFKGAAENVIGIISAKDIMRTMASRGIDYNDSVTEVIRDSYFVPETKRIAELFDELRRSGNQMAMVADEYGGLAGLVTLKRLSEEVVGPVGEEGAGPEEEYETIDRNTFLVDGGMSVEEANEELGITLPEGHFETVAGFVLEVLGHIPDEGEQFEYDNLWIDIVEMKDLKIETIRVTKTRQVEGDDSIETDTGQTRRDPAK